MPPFEDTKLQVFDLRGYGSELQNCLLLVPDGVSHEKVAAAWAYALRYTAKGLDLPDHDAAIKLMLERHPSWKITMTNVKRVGLQLELADKDVPD